MRKNKLMISGLMAMVLGLGISGTAFAYQGDFSRKGPNYTPEFEAQITEAIVNKDYEEWKDLIEEKVGNVRVTGIVNKDNFSKFAEAWQLARDGKIKEANVIRRELGLRVHGENMMNRMGEGGRGGMMRNR